MRDYRRKHGRPLAKTPAVSESLRALHSMLDCVKNNLAIDLTACPGRVWLITGDGQVKNILATAELIVIEGLPPTR